MRSLVPYAGIALAVAVGIALAPYIGWVLFWTVVALACCVALALIRRGVRRIRVALRQWADRTLA